MYSELSQHVEDLHIHGNIAVTLIDKHLVTTGSAQVNLYVVITGNCFFSRMVAFLSSWIL